MKVYIPSPGEIVQQIFRRMVISGHQNCITYLPLKDRVLLAKKDTTVRELGKACRGESSTARLDPEAEIRFLKFWEALQKRKELDQLVPPDQRRTDPEWIKANQILHSLYMNLDLGILMTNRIIMHYATATKTTRSTF